MRCLLGVKEQTVKRALISFYERREAAAETAFGQKEREADSLISVEVFIKELNVVISSQVAA